jgi:tRNA nucleotidyltransferase (CCA-adding enzyme)
MVNANYETIMNKRFLKIISKFPEDLRLRILNLKNFDQRRDFHPEGDVLTHTSIVFSRLEKFNDIDLLLAAIFHDIGKDITAGIHPKKGHITHFGHEKISAQIVLDNSDLIKNLGGDVNMVHDIIRNHMKIKIIDQMGEKKQNKLKNMACFDKLIKFSKEDHGGW